MSRQASEQLTTLDVVGMLANAFPSARVGAPTLELYEQTFASVAVHTFERACRQLILTSQFFPSIAQVLAHVQELSPVGGVSNTRPCAAPSVQDTAEYVANRQLLAEGVACAACDGGGLVLNNEERTPYLRWQLTRKLDTTVRTAFERGQLVHCALCAGVGRVLPEDVSQSQIEKGESVAND
jgi:hypothetical protein